MPSVTSEVATGVTMGTSPGSISGAMLAVSMVIVRQLSSCPRADREDGGHDEISVWSSGRDQRAVPVRWVPVKVRLSAADWPWKVLPADDGSETGKVRKSVAPAASEAGLLSVMLL